MTNSTEPQGDIHGAIYRDGATTFSVWAPKVKEG